MLDIHTALLHAARMLTAVSDTAALDAEVLLASTLGRQRTYLRAWPKKNLAGAQLQEFQKLVALRAQGRPVAYLTGKREFWSREFLVSEAVLIPRPETELLVELALELIPRHCAWSALDLGTGSGVIAITLAAERPAIDMLAVDSSADALTLAQRNARQLQTGNVRFVHSDWFSALPSTQFDLIASNPPYIAAGDPHLLQGDLRFEPQTALVAAQQGLRDIAHIAQSAKVHLKPNAHLLLEHGYEQQDAVQLLLKQEGYAQIRTHRDLAGHPRVTSAQRV